MQKYFYVPLFHLIRSSTKIIEFDNVKFPKSISSKDGYQRGFLEIKISLSFFSVISYNNTVVTKQIYFPPTFLKSWVHTCNNTAGVAEGRQ